jgi:hypothetical protein
MMPLTILATMARRSGLGLLLGALALLLLAIAPGPSLSAPFAGANEAVYVVYFALASVVAAAGCHVQFRFFYLGATAFFWYVVLTGWLLPADGVAATSAPWPTLGAIALVTAGVLFGRAAFGWATAKLPTHW